MLLSKIESLRKQPKSVRNRFAFIFALSSTLIVASIWAISLPSRVNFEPEVVAKDKNAPTIPTVTEQLSQMRNLVEDSLEDIRTQAGLIDFASTTEIFATTTIIATTTTTTTATSSLDVTD